MLKILHTADWHLGAGRRLTKGTLEYLDRQVAVWRGIIKIAREEECSAAMIVGDLAENSGTTIEEILALRKVLVEFGQVCPVLISAGNHDELSVGDFQTRWIKLLDIPNVYVTQAQPETVVLSPTGFKKLEEDSPEWEDSSAIKILSMPWTGIKNQEEFDHKIKSYYRGQQIVGLHECFAGIVTDTGKALGGVLIPNIEGVRYFACGDIHKHQRVNLPHAWYSGAPAQWNFGDKPEKGCIILEVKSEYEYTPRFVRLKSPIELIQIRSLEAISKDSPHWYQLIVPANEVPKYFPPNVKDIKPVPAKIEAPIQFSKNTESVEEIQLTVDYTDGVEELLTAAGFDPEEIPPIKQEITEIAKNHP